MGAPYSSKAKSVITCELSEQSTDRDSFVHISGNIWPVHLALVFIQISKDEGSTWDNLNMVATEGGNYSYLWKPTTSGSFLLRTLWSGDMDHKKMISPTVRIEVR
jgi:hypothetical protein